MFVIDSSGSISDDDVTNWQKIRNFLANVVDVLPREQVSVRVAAITFANRGNLKVCRLYYFPGADYTNRLKPVLGLSLSLFMKLTPVFLKILTRSVYHR